MQQQPVVTPCNEPHMGVSDTIRQPLFEVVCNERGGEVLRQVYLLLQPPSIPWVLERMEGIPSMFSTDPTDLVAKLRVFDFHGCVFLQVDDVGLIAMNKKFHFGMSDVHITFYDKRLRGREKLCQAAADWWLTICGAHALFTVCPSRSYATIAFCKRVGFREVDMTPATTIGPDGKKDTTVMLFYGGHNGV